MTETMQPAQRVVEEDHNRVILTCDRNLYPLDAIYGAAYVFIDRCYVLLDAPDANRVEVELRGRDSLAAAALEDLAGEFGNELLTQVWRQRVVEANRPIIEAVAAQALAGASGAVDDLDDLDLDGDAFDDPLGIAVSWEEKYGKEEAAPGTGDGSDDA